MKKLKYINYLYNNIYKLIKIKQLKKLNIQVLKYFVYKKNNNNKKKLQYSRYNDIESGKKIHICFSLPYNHISYTRSSLIKIIEKLFLLKLKWRLFVLYIFYLIK